MKKLLITLMLATLGTTVSAKASRSTETIRAFKESNVCPSTGNLAIKGIAASYICPGYVVDHGIPRCAGGPDAAHNLFYQKKDRENSLKKDKAEMALCRRMKAAGLKFQELDEEDAE